MQADSTNRHAPKSRQACLALLAIATATALTACTPVTPRAGTLPALTPTSNKSTPTAISNSPIASAYEPATPTAPAKNVPKPVMPALAKDKSEAGQRAFIEYWLETYNYMRESGDTKPFLAACHKDSKFCQGSVKNLEELQNRGIWRMGKGITVGPISRFESTDSAVTHIWAAQAVEAPARYFDPQGESRFVRTQSGESRYSVVINLARTSNEWKTREFGGDQK